MDPIEKMPEPLEKFAESPLYIDVRPLVAAVLMFFFYTLMSERPAAQRYLNIKSMARDNKPQR